MRTMSPRPLNDALHSQLSKSHKPAQLEIDALDQGPGRLSYGRCRVLEISARSALNDFTMGGHARGIAWSLNPYVGCLHSCRYCYVPDTLHVERNKWGRYVVVKHNLPNLLRKELRIHPRLTVYVSTGTDPYQSLESEHCVTQRCLKLLADKDWPVEVLTRSPLVLRDVKILGRFTQLRVGLSVPTLDDQARRLMEPAAPAIPARLRTLRRLVDRGLQVFANYAPAYPLTGGLSMRDVAQAFWEAGVQWVNTSYWKRPAGFLGPVWDQVHRTDWADFARFIVDPKRQAELRTELAKSLKAVGIPLRTGFFNPPFESGSALSASTEDMEEAWSDARGALNSSSPNQLAALNGIGTVGPS